MKLYTNDGKEYNIKWLEYWDDITRFILAETTDGDEIKIELDNFDKVEEK